MATLFVSDLHLHPSRPAILACFKCFLEQQRGQAEALYILGDLFEAWIGDDDPEPVYAAVRSALRGCVVAGTPVFVMRGNRDFLLGERFAADTGCTLIEDPLRIRLYGVATLLMHGDSLCIDDREYQAMRRKLRDPRWQHQVAALPLAERRALAQRARELSTLSQRSKSDSLMDVNAGEVLRVMHEQEVELLIHGHTHRAAVHRLRAGGRDLTRIDLGDWYKAGNALVIEADGARRFQPACPGWPLPA